MPDRRATWRTLALLAAAVTAVAACSSKSSSSSSAGTSGTTGAAAAGATCPILYPLGDDVRLMIDTFSSSVVS